MKGLYCQAGASESNPKFVIRETVGFSVVFWCFTFKVDLLSDVGIQRNLIPVGREMAGVVLQVGDKVSSFQPEDEVVGILPLDSPYSGLCDAIDIDEHYLVETPQRLSMVCVAGALRDGVCAYTALHTHARMAVGHTLLITDGASSFGLMCIQLACYHGVKVLTTSYSPQTHKFLEQLRPSVGMYRVIPVYDCSSDLVSVVLEETGGLGVDIFVDSGVRLQEAEEESEEIKPLPYKHDIISVLGVGGHWVTSHKDLQLDPPDCRLLHLKSASVTFLNHEVWMASSAQQGRYLRILNSQFPLNNATVAMETVQRHQKTKMVVQL
uniref:Enoyl reductase (ER) domain-containing protein n=1 Tax=Mola mola TaxID=94237 RepID=A0A3Q4AV27_MOLML